MPTTRRDMRRGIARAMSDVVTLTATSGSNNMLVDPVELTDYDNSFAGSQAVCISASNPDNVGKVVRIAGNSQSGTNISFVPELPSPVEAGDVFDMHNLRGRGFRVQDYNEQIASVVRTHANSAPRKTEAEPHVFAIESPYVPIPENWVTVHAVVLHSNGWQADIHNGRYDGARGWRVESSGQFVQISGSDAGMCDGNEVVLHGFEAHPPVENDDDMIYLNPEFVQLMVQAALAQRRGDPNWNQWAVEWSRMAAGSRPGKLPAWPPNTTWLEGA